MRQSLLFSLLAALLLATSTQVRAAATLDPSTLQFDIPYLLYQAEQSDVPVWVRLEFVQNEEGRLLWRLKEYGLVTPSRQAERANERPAATISSDLQLLEVPDLNIAGMPLAAFAATLVNVPSQDSTIVYELRNYQLIDMLPNNVS
jgi:hypothetical protein